MINYTESYKIKNQFMIPDFFSLHAIFNLHCKFLYTDTISIPAMYRIIYNKAWKMKSEFIIPYFFLFTCYINLHHEILYSGSQTPSVFLWV